MGGAVHVVCDSELCVTGVQRRQRGGDNWDLWGRLWQVVQRKHLLLEAQWVKSHGDEHPEYFVQYHLDVADCFGNCCADRLALEAAWGGGGAQSGSSACLASDFQCSVQ